MSNPAIQGHQLLQRPQVGSVPWQPMDLTARVCDSKCRLKWKPPPERNRGDGLPCYEPPLTRAAEEQDAFRADLYGSEPVHAKNDDCGDHGQGKRGGK